MAYTHGMSLAAGNFDDRTSVHWHATYPGVLVCNSCFSLWRPEGEWRCVLIPRHRQDTLADSGFIPLGPAPTPIDYCPGCGRKFDRLEPQVKVEET